MHSTVSAAKMNDFKSVWLLCESKLPCTGTDKVPQTSQNCDIEQTGGNLFDTCLRFGHCNWSEWYDADVLLGLEVVLDTRCFTQYDTVWLTLTDHEQCKLVPTPRHAKLYDVVWITQDRCRKHGFSGFMSGERGPKSHQLRYFFCPFLPHQAAWRHLQLSQVFDLSSNS